MNDQEVAAIFFICMAIIIIARIVSTHVTDYKIKALEDKKEESTEMHTVLSRIIDQNQYLNRKIIEHKEESHE